MIGACTCPTDATLDEIVAVGGHWPDCPRGQSIETALRRDSGETPERPRALPVDRCAQCGERYHGACNAGQ